VIDPAGFLTSLSHALSALGLYGPDHPAAKRAIETAYNRLRLLQSGGRAQFTFLHGEVLFGDEVLHELDGWEWGPRLAGAGIERLETTGEVDPEHFERFLESVAARLGLAHASTAEIRQVGPSSIRFGMVELHDRKDGDVAAREAAAAPLPIATLAYSLGVERQAVEWMHREIGHGARLPLVEADAVIRSLSLAMHAEQAMVLPLVQLKEFDQYTTSHSMNVAVLTMALAEHLELGAGAVRAFGTAGLMHDLGKVKIPRHILEKPGALTPDERAVVQEHPAEGARILLSGADNLDLAASVAYEHHLMIDGGGYPCRHYPRGAHYASRLVHVCDVYDALRTRRPYRDAWESDRALAYIESRAGTEFDPAIARAFVTMMQRWDQRVVTTEDAPAAAG
jgi:putative nucleotidyltransferase with HDIG domain